MAFIQTPEAYVVILPLGFVIRSLLYLFPPLTLPTPDCLPDHILQVAELLVR